MPKVRFAVIGDSFAEGMGDELPDGYVRGWGDLVAQGWANSVGEEVSYLNLAVRGKLAWQIIEEQLDEALALGPTHLAYNGGGNDLIRPKVDIDHLADSYARVLHRCDEEGVRLIVLSGGNPSAQLPLGNITQRRGDEMAVAVAERLRDRSDVVQVLNWSDAELSDPRYWAPDRLHLNAYGHHRVAARMLSALGEQPAESWWTAQGMVEAGPTGLRYYRTYLGPWIGRRIRGESSGDDHPAKYSDWVPRHPE